MKSKKPLVISIFLAAIAALLVWSFLVSLESKYTKKAQRIKVLVARGDISEGTVLEEVMVDVAKIPNEFVTPKALENVEDIKKETYITLVPIMAGEQITTTKLTIPGKESGLAYIVPTGKRAMTVSVDEAVGMADLVKPGNHVDVLATYDLGEKSVTGTIIQNVLVLATKKNVLGASESKQKQTSSGEMGPAEEVARTITLAVTPEEAQKLALGLEKGSINLSLRPINDNELALVSDISLSGSISRQAEARPQAKK